MLTYTSIYDNEYEEEDKFDKYSIKHDMTEFNMLPDNVLSAMKSIKDLLKTQFNLDIFNRPLCETIFVDIPLEMI